MSWLGKLFGRKSSTIADVQLHNNYYRVLNNKGKVIAEERASKVGELCGIGPDFMLFQKNNYYVTYNEKFKKLEEVRMSSIGHFSQITNQGIQFRSDNKPKVYDKELKRIS